MGFYTSNSRIDGGCGGSGRWAAAASSNDVPRAARQRPGHRVGRRHHGRGRRRDLVLSGARRHVAGRRLAVFGSVSGGHLVILAAGHDGDGRRHVGVPAVGGCVLPPQVDVPPEGHAVEAAGEEVGLGLVDAALGPGRAADHARVTLLARAARQPPDPGPVHVVQAHVAIVEGNGDDGRGVSGECGPIEGGKTPLSFLNESISGFWLMITSSKRFIIDF